MLRVIDHFICAYFFNNCDQSIYPSISDFFLGVPVILNKLKKVARGTVVVRWEPPIEGACPVMGYNVSYREVISPWQKSKWHSAIVKGKATNYTLRLRCGKEYEIKVTSLIGQRKSSMTDNRKWKFKIGGGNASLILVSTGNPFSQTIATN